MKFKSSPYLLQSAVFAIVVFACTSLSAQSKRNTAVTANPAAMNVVLIVADDMGMQMSCLGTPGVKTPTLDSLVKAGTLFTKAYAAFPSCSPSRASFLTGNYPHVTGVTTNVWEHVGEPTPEFIKSSANLNVQFAIKDSLTTIAEVLKANGYFTGLTGKFHTSPHKKFPFDYWGDPVDARGFLAAAKQSGKPFFLDFNMHSPHRKYQASPNDRSKTDLQELQVPAFLPNNTLMQQDWSDYLGAVEDTDHTVAELLRLLKAQKMDKNTLVIFISDHGPSIHRGKYSAYPFGSHVPVVFSGASLAAGKKIHSPFSLVNLVPTMLDILKLPLPGKMNGKSFKAVLHGAAPDSFDYAFTEVSFPRKGETNFQARAVTDGRYWYIRRNGKPRMKGKPEDNYEVKSWGNYSYKATMDGKLEYPLQYRLLEIFEETPPMEELFDLHSDPWTMHDLMGKPEYKAALLRLRKRMNEFILKTQDKEMMNQSAY